jgi:hypothetical protein
MMRSGRERDSMPDPRPSSRRRGPSRVGVLLALLVCVGLVACEEQQQCFAIGQSCTQASAYSEFFSPGAPCCEGTCTPLPNPPGQNFEGTLAECQ